MSDVNRVSANEQARADAIKASQKKVKVKNAETTGTQKGAAKQAQAQGANKNLKSTFDDVLDTLTEQNMPVIPQESKFDSALKEIQRDDDYSHRDQEGDEDDHKTQDKTDSKEGSKESSTGVRGRVAGKKHSGEQGQGGSGSDKDSKGDQGGQNKAQQGSQLKKPGTEPQAGPAPAPIFQGPKIGQVQAPEAAAAPRELPKAVLDQIIQSVTIMRDKELNTEMQIEFKDNFFNGLKLKVRKKNNEISIEFLVPNQSVAATFRNERDKIATAMGDKGVDIRDIEVRLQ